MTPLDPVARQREVWAQWSAGRAQALGAYGPLHTLDTFTLTAGQGRLRVLRDQAAGDGIHAGALHRIDGWLTTIEAELMGRTP